MKPLMKHEFKRILLPTLSLIAISCIVCGVMLNLNMSFTAEAYVIGVERYKMFIGVFLDVYPILLIFSAGIIMWLVYSQFHEDKVDGTGDFIATLPYTQKEKFVNKVWVGTIAIFISALIGIILAYTVYNTYFYYTESMCVNSIFGEEIMAKSGFVNTLLVMVNGYLGILIWYLFLVVFQYSVYSTIGGIVIGTLSVISIPYILNGITMYLEPVANLGRNITDPVMALLYKLVFCLMPVQYMDICYSNGECGLYVITLANDYHIKLLVLISIIVILFTMSKCLAKKYGLTSRKTLMINKVVEYIFKIGVTVCSALIPVVFLEIFLGSSDYGMFVITLFIILTGAIGYIISHKITVKGRG